MEYGHAPIFGNPETCAGVHREGGVVGEALALGVGWGGPRHRAGVTMEAVGRVGHTNLRLP